jgi:site-specific DNA recombinase
MSDRVSEANGRVGRVAAIYARVSSERQRQDETIRSQTVGLRELAAQRGLLVVEDLVFEDEGFSGATLTRPALERLRDRAAEGAFEVLLCHAPDRLARRYAYQVLLLEELVRVGVEVVFARGGEHSGSPEDELLRQFQGTIAEYERAQIRERTRRGKLHRARTGHQAVMAGAPYGYRFIKKTEHTEGYWEINETEAHVVREVFRRYTEEQVAIAELARWLTAQQVPTRTGKTVWDRSTVWGCSATPPTAGRLHTARRRSRTSTASRRARPVLAASGADAARYAWMSPSSSGRSSRSRRWSPTRPSRSRKSGLPATRTSPSATPRSRRCCRGSSSAASVATPATAARPGRRTSGSTTTGASAPTTTVTRRTRVQQPPDPR